MTLGITFASYSQEVSEIVSEEEAICAEAYENLAYEVELFGPFTSASSYYEALVDWMRVSC